MYAAHLYILRAITAAAPGDAPRPRQPAPVARTPSAPAGATAVPRNFGNAGIWLRQLWRGEVRRAPDLVPADRPGADGPTPAVRNGP